MSPLRMFRRSSNDLERKSAMAGIHRLLFLRPDAGLGGGLGPGLPEPWPAVNSEVPQNRLDCALNWWARRIFFHRNPRRSLAQVSEADRTR